jgi:hypothetical protein
MRERDLCYTVWKVRKRDYDRERLKRARKTVTRLVKTAKRNYMARFLNPGLATKILWKNLRSVGIVENSIDSAPIIYTPNELNMFYSSNHSIAPTCPTCTSANPQTILFNFRTVSISEVQCVLLVQMRLGLTVFL